MVGLPVCAEVMVIVTRSLPDRYKNRLSPHPVLLGLAETVQPLPGGNKMTQEIDFSALASPKDHEPESGVPNEVKNFVTASHEHWKTISTAWREVTLASEDAVQEVIRMAKEYARATGRTFRVKTHPDKNKLVYKVTDKVTKNGKNNAHTPL
jgi:hypothetical protein